eukprot:CAMPEP_0116896062 /NCGR_PEP_ID=MMETSP0467-20121206/5406_1 /TAXON_ID=283647 /ORGANISM="Mesodinium pulex, Strain SPMC105" /LENGTH=89 /DNA_ID=CAMNT_0004567057 /DNA_START=768 /DNA_END=1037 /DNA_ORIENTATION=+
MGHVIDKIEILILGGTWSHYPVEESDWHHHRDPARLHQSRGDRQIPKVWGHPSAVGPAAHRRQDLEDHRAWLQERRCGVSLASVEKQLL